MANYSHLTPQYAAAPIDTRPEHNVYHTAQRVHRTQTQTAAGAALRRQRSLLKHTR